MKASLYVLLAGVAAMVMMVGCETTPVQQGALIGGALGAGGGAIIGNNTGGHHGGTGALIGGLGGAAAGALIGDQVGKSRQQAPAAPPPPAPSVAQRGHYENRTVTTQSGETYEERVWVPDR
jgi:hypothetical protein